MDEKAFLLQEIRYSKRKQNVKKFLRYESTGIAAGGTIAMVLEMCLALSTVVSRAVAISS